MQAVDVDTQAYVQHDSKTTQNCHLQLTQGRQAISVHLYFPACAGEGAREERWEGTMAGRIRQKRTKDLGVAAQQKQVAAAQ